MQHVTKNINFEQLPWRSAGFAQQNGFGLSFLHMMLPPVKDTAKSNTCC
jgi:hypothetical protein